MSILAQHIKAQPHKPMREWAQDFGISRPHLLALMAGDRMPSVDVALRIEAKTGGAVPLDAWSNIRAMRAALASMTTGAAE